MMDSVNECFAIWLPDRGRWLFRIGHSGTVHTSSELAGAGLFPKVSVYFEQQLRLLKSKGIKAEVKTVYCVEGI